MRILCFVLMVATGIPASIRELPTRLLIGYSTNCNDQVLQAVRDGINVVVWSFMEIEMDRNNPKKVRINYNSLDLNCIREAVERLDEEGYGDTVHLVSFGGWNGPHLDPKLSAKDWYIAWKTAVGNIFHGLDWDLEGHDNLHSPTNVLTLECLEKMGQISLLAKQDGYIVGMAPPQSYLDCSNHEFSRKVNLIDPKRSWHADFNYFGANVYAYILAKFADAIDFVAIQFYESYSRAAMSIYSDKMLPEAYLEKYVKDLVEHGNLLQVNFEDDLDTQLSNQKVSLPLSKLVWGFANGWALDTDKKALFVDPSAIETAYLSLSQAGHAPRGFMFWVLGEEGSHGFYFSRALNNILKIRNVVKNQDVITELDEEL